MVFMGYMPKLGNSRNEYEQYIKYSGQYIFHGKLPDESLCGIYGQVRGALAMKNFL
jgi:hypothetical protein